MRVCLAAFLENHTHIGIGSLLEMLKSSSRILSATKPRTLLHYLNQIGLHNTQCPVIMLLPKIEPDYEGIRQKVHEMTRCAHKQTVLRRKVSSSGVATAWHQCTNCGLRVGKATPKAVLGDKLQALPLWDMELERQFFRSRDELQRRMVEQQELHARQEWDRLYEEYLRTPEWQNRRRLVMERASGLCEGCRSHPASDVHHLTYAHAGEEFLFELVALCRGCHERLHQPEKKITV